ncbi:hypothetical protein KM043_000618 [Ampulex compressa]|nr:hypothetical protein KM043_000618 [Ampulex compressa]
MDGTAITRKSIRKRARIGDKGRVFGENISSCRSPLASLPVEVILEIFSYLTSEDLRVLKRVSTFFKRIAQDPVTNNGKDTSRVIKDLKRMSLLRKFSMSARSDSDDILRQLSRTNKKLQELYVFNCTGSTSKLYLRSTHLIRILERCRYLHTISISGSRFRGRKFYRLLAGMGLRLRAVSVPATAAQFSAFISQATHIPEEDRETIRAASPEQITWQPLDYVLIRKPNCLSTVLIRYLRINVVSIDDEQTRRKPSRS